MHAASAAELVKGSQHTNHVVMQAASCIGISIHEQLAPCKHYL